MPEICVIGAGWAGLSAAHRLHRAGREVVVVEKARGPGGRSATRRQDGFAFDHGAQYFTARSPEFAAVVNDWKQGGLVATWYPAMAVFGERPDDAGTTPSERLVGTPSRNAVLKALAADLYCRFGCRVVALGRDRQGWIIDIGQTDPLRADVLILTAPPRQAADLLLSVNGPDAGKAHEMARRVEQVPMNPCWSVMLGYEHPVSADFDAAFDNEGPLAWMARDSSKPGRRGESWLLHASAEWSVRHLEDEPAGVAKTLLEAFGRRVPAALQQQPGLIAAHRWRYALAPEPLERSCLADGELDLLLAGDWCAGNRIEGAWHSGTSAADRVLDGLLG